MSMGWDERTVGWRDVAAWTMVEDVAIAALQAGTSLEAVKLAREKRSNGDDRG